MSRDVFDAVVDLAARGSSARYESLLSARDPDEVRQAVVSTAQFHLVGGLVGATLAAQLPDDPLAAAFAPLRQRAALHHLRVMADLRRVAALLDARHIAWAVMKGPFLVEHAYRRFDVRSYSDLDLLVDRHRFGEVLTLLASDGAKLRDRNWPMIAGSDRGELSVVLPHGTLLDLHWHVVTDRPVRDGFRIDVDDLLAHRRLVGQAPDALAALETGDAWFHTALHAVLSGADRLLWAIDLQRLLAADGALGPEQWARAERFGWAAPGAIAADMVLSVFPEERARLGTPPRHTWQLVRSRVVRDTGLNRTLDSRYSAKLFTTSVRRNTVASARAFAGRAWDQSIKGLATNPEHPWRRRRRGLEPIEAPVALSPLKDDVPSPVDRQRFLDRISSAR